jgi:hypothetical protein
MKRKKISYKFLAFGTIFLFCLLWMTLAPGCKKEGDEEKSDEIKSTQPEEKQATSKEQEQETDIQAQAERLEFDLDEVSVFEEKYEISRDFLRGSTTLCSNKPRGSDNVTYPQFVSNNPLYGSISLNRRAINPSEQNKYHYAIDESGGTGTGYNRLYFDKNHDLDLTNEQPLMSLNEPPDTALLKYSSIEQQVCFDRFSEMFDFGSAGMRAIEVMPRLTIRKGRSELSFIATKILKGEVDIHGAKYEAFLGYQYSIGMPFDQPGIVFHLVSKGDPQYPPRWWGADQLNSTHAIGGKFYRFATTPLGDKIYVNSYDGAVGAFEVGVGKRDIQNVTIRGSLRSKDMAVAIGGELERGWPRFAKRCQLPEDDYLPAFLTVQMGPLNISVSNNYHEDGKLFGQGSRLRVYGIKIHKDKPFVLDFTNEPNVMFASPAKNHRVMLGESLQVKAVLIDSELDIMLRRLYDTSEAGKRVSLDPKVTITRANGEKVAEGVMPFG